MSVMIQRQKSVEWRQEGRRKEKLRSERQKKTVIWTKFLTDNGSPIQSTSQAETAFRTNPFHEQYREMSFKRLVTTVTSYTTHTDDTTALSR
jgi:hypothetical protein